jgi:hypothetical protein
MCHTNNRRGMQRFLTILSTGCDMFAVRSGILRTFVFTSLVSSSVASVQAEEPTPAGWFKAGNQPGDYAMTTDRAEKHGGAASAMISCTAAPPGRNPTCSAERAGLRDGPAMIRTRSGRADRLRERGYALRPSRPSRRPP